MQKITLFFTVAVVLRCSIPVTAQVSLPYYSGFDNTTQQNGWTEYKKASTQFSHWGYGSFNAYSAPNSIGHDYSPSTGITLTDNWFVSPGFDISNGGVLDSVRYKFQGFSTPDAGDTVGIYLLQGSPDPASATGRTLLFDFRGSEYVTDNTYRVKSNITLPPSGGLSYLAFRYRNTDCSSKWLTVYFDNVAISGGMPIGVTENGTANALRIYPNPTNGKFSINYPGKVTSVRILNSLGQVVREFSNLGTSAKAMEIDLSGQSPGFYLVEVSADGRKLIRKILRK